ncbi:MAG TPA: hypothetical protein VEA16_19380, partial [Vicinamibacterales bacterium]|nr:hypothetical protein [Vicinamibacterales bacterium]
RMAYAAAVALALGFGAREVTAAPAAERARPYCEDDLHCQQTCDLMYGEGTRFGICSSGHTCYCY